MEKRFSVSSHLPGPFDELRLTAWASSLREQLGQSSDLGLVFMTPEYAPHARAALEIIRMHAHVPLLAGCSGASLVAGSREFEETPGIVLGLYHLPGASLKAIHLEQAQLEEQTSPAYWYTETGITQAKCNGWLALVDPFSFDAESWLRQWNQAYAPLPIVGGLASGDSSSQSTQLYLQGEAYDGGAIVISVGGKIRIQALVSQGCTPIGEPWIITQSDRNFIQQIAKQPAYKVLMDTFQALNPEEQKQARGNLFVGLVMNEYREQFHRGDFLVRTLLGGDPKSGILAVGALPRTGQTVQFQRRDANAATEDMVELLVRARSQLGSKTVYGGCLCCCNGRGIGLFGTPDHDAALVQHHLGPMGLAGFFCNGEIGPVDHLSYLHGYTASLAMFVEC